MKIEFERGEVVRKERRTIPANYYNLLRLLLVRSVDEAVFIPVRTLQYLAIIDKQEIIFVDGRQTRDITLSWQNFSAQNREDLVAPVAFDAVYYKPVEDEFDQRLFGELQKALTLFQSRQRNVNHTNDVIELGSKKAKK